MGSGFRLCNNESGEWYAIVVQEGKARPHKKKQDSEECWAGQIDCIVQVKYQLRAPVAAPASCVSLLYAPPKSHARHRFLLEKATEIGAHVLQPVQTGVCRHCLLLKAESLASRAAAAEGARGARTEEGRTDGEPESRRCRAGPDGCVKW